MIEYYCMENDQTIAHLHSYPRICQIDALSKSELSKWSHPKCQGRRKMPKRLPTTRMHLPDFFLFFLSFFAFSICFALIRFWSMSSTFNIQPRIRKQIRKTVFQKIISRNVIKLILQWFVFVIGAIVGVCHWRVTYWLEIMSSSRSFMCMALWHECSHRLLPLLVFIASDTVTLFPIHSKSHALAVTFNSGTPFQLTISFSLACVLMLRRSTLSFYTCANIFNLLAITNDFDYISMAWCSMKRCEFYMETSESALGFPFSCFIVSPVHCVVHEARQQEQQQNEWNQSNSSTMK